MKANLTQSHPVAQKQVFDLNKNEKGKKSKQIDDQTMSDEDQSCLTLPNSGKSVFGLDNHDQYQEQLLKSNFHARIIHQM